MPGDSQQSPLPTFRDQVTGPVRRRADTAKKMPLLHAKMLNRMKSDLCERHVSWDPLINIQSQHSLNFNNSQAIQPCKQSYILIAYIVLLAPLYGKGAIFAR